MKIHYYNARWIASVFVVVPIYFFDTIMHCNESEWIVPGTIPQSEI